MVICIKIIYIFIILKFIIFRIFQIFYHIAFYHICQKNEIFIICTLSYWDMNKSDLLSYLFIFLNMIKNRQIWIKKKTYELETIFEKIILAFWFWKKSTKSSTWWQNWTHKNFGGNYHYLVSPSEIEKNKIHCVYP